MRPLGFTLSALALAIAACGGEGDVATNQLEDAGPGGQGGSGGSGGPLPDGSAGGGGASGSGGSDAGADAGPPPAPGSFEPCGPGQCWDTSAGLSRCGDATVDEDYSTGNFNVHRFATTLYADSVTTVTLTRTGGSWQPAIGVVQSDGTVLYDGTVGLQQGGLTTTSVENGKTGAVARVAFDAQASRSVDVFVTGWSVIDSGFVDFLPMDATYELVIDSECTGEVPCVVNGNVVDQPACGWLNAIGRDVVPLLADDRDTNLTNAARVAWWSLKEGVLFLDNPIVYSNCNYPSGDMHVGPLVVCPSGRAWQVGLSGVQVPTFQLSALETTAGQLYPMLTVEQVLEQTAADALLDAGDAAAVKASTGDLRRSWLLRNSAIGFTHQVDIVTRECIDDTRSWCFGTGWTATQLFAPNQAAAMGAIDDIRAILDSVAP